MEAPEKIFICDYGSEVSYEWHSESEFETKGHNDIEYTRTDAFIDKALEWLCNNYDKYIRVIGSSIYPAYSDLCMDFENYMKGE